jgi:hypothetical protein
MAQCEEEAKTNLLLLTRVTNRIDIDSNDAADPINKHDSSRFNFIVSSFKVYYAFFYSDFDKQEQEKNSHRRKSISVTMIYNIRTCKRCCFFYSNVYVR